MDKNHFLMVLMVGLVLTSCASTNTQPSHSQSSGSTSSVDTSACYAAASRCTVEAVASSYSEACSMAAQGTQANVDKVTSAIESNKYCQ